MLHFIISVLFSAYTIATSVGWNWLASFARVDPDTLKRRSASQGSLEKGVLGHYLSYFVNGTHENDKIFQYKRRMPTLSILPGSTTAMNFCTDILLCYILYTYTFVPFLLKHFHLCNCYTMWLWLHAYVNKTQFSYVYTYISDLYYLGIGPIEGDEPS